MDRRDLDGRPSAAGCVRVKDFGDRGLKIAYREGSVDERAIEPSLSLFADIGPEARAAMAEYAIMDIGAHIGGFTLPAAKLAHRGRVYAVEASGENYELLLRNIEINALENVAPAHLAISDRTGKALLHKDPGGNWGHSLEAHLSQESELVETETLVGYLDHMEIECCDYAKLNVEGSEFPLLMSSSPETLRRIRRMLVYCHADLAGGRYSDAELRTHLEEAGFEVEAVAQSAPERSVLRARRR
jgi:FkbM family methyltransferase